MPINFKELGAKIADWAPALGGIVGGPGGALAGKAVDMIADAFGLQSSAVTPQVIEELVKTNPDAIIKIKEIESNMILSLDDMHLKDVQNARGREVSVTQAIGKREVNLYVLAYLYTAGFFVSMGFMIFLMVAGKWPQGIPSEVALLIGNLVGCLTSITTTIATYFFGSSKSSADKTAAMANGKG